MCSKVYLNDIYKYMHILHHVQHSIELLQLNKLCISNFAHYKFVLEEKNEENDQQQVYKSFYIILVLINICKSYPSRPKQIPNNNCGAAPQKDFVLIIFLKFCFGFFFFCLFFISIFLLIFHFSKF